MLAVQFKLKKPKKRAWLLFAAALVIMAAVLLLLHGCAGNGAHTTPLTPGRDGYRAFFRERGLQTDGAPVRSDTVRIPDDFDAVYAAYNALQQQAGWDLTPFRGQEVRRLTFSVQNGSAPLAVLLVRGDRVIGGHLTDGVYGSPMLPLTANQTITGTNHGTTR